MAFQGNGPSGSTVNVGIELKKINDLGSSLRTGRLNGDQFVKMQNTYDVIWLFVEGDYKVTPEGQLAIKSKKGKPELLHGWTAVELLKRLFTLQEVAGVKVFHTADRRQTITALAALYRWWTDKDFEEHQSHVQIKSINAFAATTQFVKTIETLPGVGLAVAKAAERKFNKSITTACVAPVNEWADVTTTDRKGNTKKLGMSKAIKIKEAVK
jgi:ERCC4-type nuclease